MPGQQVMCMNCGQTFEPPERGRPKIYCSPRCRNRAHRKQQRQDAKPKGNVPADLARLQERQRQLEEDAEARLRDDHHPSCPCRLCGHHHRKESADA